jgi:hypothetical protein
MSLFVNIDIIIKKTFFYNYNCKMVLLIRKV